MAEKKIVVELSVLEVREVLLSARGDGWNVAASYVLSDAGKTVRRFGSVELSIDGKQTVEEVYASLIPLIEAKEGLA